MAAVVEIHQQVARLLGIQAVSGLLEEATCSTRRVPIETKNSTHSRRSQAVSTVNRSQARIVFPCWRRNDLWGTKTPCALGEVSDLQAGRQF